MAMLAERRERKRYNLVPRGKALYEDENRFGTRMLEKMGWSKGKGLGANESGDKDFVRIRYKHDNEGLGFQDRNDQWTQHGASFDGLLKQLNDGSEELSNESCDAEEVPRTMGFGFQKQPKDKPKVNLSGESLEQKSKKSKARVHYMKFTRGKDISQYSEKDLANIFGRKMLVQETAGMLDVVNLDQKASSRSSQVALDQEDKKDSTFGVTTVNSGKSINDYFRSKLKLNGIIENEFNDSRLNGEPQTLPSTNDKKSKKLHCRENVEESLVKQQHEILEAREGKDKSNKKRVELNTIKKKSKRKGETGESSTLDGNFNSIVFDQSERQEYDNKKVEAKKKSKRKKVDKTTKIIDVTQQNSLPYLIEESKRKHKKSKRNELVDKFDLTLDDVSTFANVSNENSLEPVIKKRKRQRDTADILESEYSIFNSQPINYEDMQFPRKKKSKKSTEDEKSSEQITISKTCEEGSDNNTRNDKKSPKLKEDSRVHCIGDIESSSAIVKAKTSNHILENDGYASNVQAILQDQLDEPQLSQGSLSTSKQPTNHNEFRFPELTRRKRKKKLKHRNSSETNDENQSEPPAATTIVETSQHQENESEKVMDYKINGFKAEKFYNVNIDGFPGSNFPTIVGYGLSGRIKFQILNRPQDAKMIKNLYQAEFELIERQEIRNQQMKGKKRTFKVITLFPENLV